MKRHLPLLIFVFGFTLVSYGQAKNKTKAPAESKAPVVFDINAGSRAPWGTNQNLTIDANGKCDYRFNDVVKGPKDSLKFNLDKGQIDTLLKRANEFGFFKLDSNYVKGLDGSGIYMAIRYGDKVRDVNVINREVPEVRKIIELLNSMLLPHKISLLYARSARTF